MKPSHSHGADATKDTPDAAASGRTQPATHDQNAAPRLPHERDESSDSQRQGVRPIIKKAHDDVEAGRTDTDKGVPMDRAYAQQKTPGTDTGRS